VLTFKILEFIKPSMSVKCLLFYHNFAKIGWDELKRSLDLKHTEPPLSGFGQQPLGPEFPRFCRENRCS